MSGSLAGLEKESFTYALRSTYYHELEQRALDFRLLKMLHRRQHGITAQAVFDPFGEPSSSSFLADIYRRLSSGSESRLIVHLHMRLGTVGPGGEGNDIFGVGYPVFALRLVGQCFVSHRPVNSFST